MKPSPDVPKPGRAIFGLSPNVFFLGVVSLLNDASSEMIFTLLPLFLSNVLGTSTTIIGLISGLSGSVDALFRIYSGWLSDRVGKRKFLAVIGYSLSTVVKPVMYIAMSWPLVLAVRFGDRIGKGLRSSPRDALLADSMTAAQRGKGFGLHRAMDTAGAVIGLGIAAAIIYVLQGGGLELSLKTYQWLVLVGIIPAVLAVLVLFATVREKKKTASARPGPSLKFGAGLDTRFKVFLGIIAVFTLGNSGDFFVILRAQNLGASVIYVTLMLVLLNVVYAVISVPAGLLSDKLGRRRVIAIGWLVCGLVYLGFALATSLWQVWVLFAVYGLYHGVVEGVARAFVADLVTEDKRGTAYGLYLGVEGLAVLPAGVIAGWLWQTFSPAVTFYFGAALALLAAAGIVGLMSEGRAR